MKKGTGLIELDTDSEDRLKGTGTRGSYSVHCYRPLVVTTASMGYHNVTDLLGLWPMRAMLQDNLVTQTYRSSSSRLSSSYILVYNMLVMIITQFATFPLCWSIDTWNTK